MDGSDTAIHVGDADAKSNNEDTHHVGSEQKPLMEVLETARSKRKLTKPESMELCRLKRKDKKKKTYARHERQRNQK